MKEKSKLKKGKLYFFLILILFIVSFLSISNNLTGRSVNIGTSANIGPAIEPEGGAVAGGGGGGGTSLAKKTYFKLDRDLIKVLIKQGESKRETISITNTGNTVLDMNIEPKLIERFMVISEESFSLDPGEIKLINIDIFAKEDEVPDAYTGKIIIDGDGITKVINVIIEVKERKPLFDVKVDIIEQKLGPGGYVKANIKIINMGDLKPIDILFYYAIKNFDGSILSYKEESLAIDEELNIMRTLKIPEDILSDYYVFYSKVSYEDYSKVPYEYIKAVGSDVFEITKERVLEIEKPFMKNVFVKIIIILVVIFGIIAVFLILNKQTYDKKGAQGFIEDSLKKGYSKEHIKDEFFKKDWPKRIVDKLFK